MALPDIPPAAVTNATVAIYQVLERAVVAVSGPGDADVRLRQIASEAAVEALTASAPPIAGAAVTAEREKARELIAAADGLMEAMYNSDLEIAWQKDRDRWNAAVEAAGADQP